MDEEHVRRTEKFVSSLLNYGAGDRQAIERATNGAKPTELHLAVMAAGVAIERDAYAAIAEAYGLHFSDAGNLVQRVNREVNARLGAAFQDAELAFPVEEIRGGVLVASPHLELDLAILKKGLGVREIHQVLVTRTDFARLRKDISLGQYRGAASERRSLDEEAQAVDLLDAMVLDAVGERATDLHLEVYAGKVRVRRRVDGHLADFSNYQLRPEQLRAIINVLKIRATLDIAEQRLPQGGHFETTAGGKVFDLRVQIQPSFHGEHAIIRFLSRGTDFLSLEQLGLAYEVAQAFRRVLRQPSGLVLVVGPTGSGKSTTLYAGLAELARDGSRKVITIEDPVEYPLDGIQQAEVKPEIGFHFADAMRSFVRQDPDIIFLGEIRDTETALEAIRASQTGHLVLATLHSNDGVDAVQRLFDLGMHPNSLSSELHTVFAQRLVRKNCPACLGNIMPSGEVIQGFFPTGVPTGIAFHAGRGCERCGHTGSLGRFALMEYLPLGKEFRLGVSHKLAVDELRAIAHAAGGTTLRDAALEALAKGHVSLDELARVLPIELMRVPKTDWVETLAEAANEPT